MSAIRLNAMGITEIGSYDKAVPIGNGWDRDVKYRIEMPGGNRMMLRISGKTNYAFCERLFRVIKELAASGVPVPHPVGFGICNSNKSVYLLLNWCNGHNLAGLLPSLSETEQCGFGLKAGRILRRIHSIPAPKSTGDWASGFIEGKLRAFGELTQRGITIEGGNAIIQFIEDNKHLVTNARLCLHHGDFHAGNLIVTEDGELTVIDWDNFRYGDPWNDFMEIHNAELYPYFLSGLLRGYFDRRPPCEFWPMLALHISSAVLASVCWAVKDAPGSVDTCVQNVHNALRAFDYMKNAVPTWYIEG